MHVNNDFQRNANMSRVFEAVWRQQSVSRIDIAREFGLYRSTVSNIISALIEGGVVLESGAGNATAKGGRKPVSLSINKDFGCVLGIELQPESFSAVALDLCGTVLMSMGGQTPVDERLIASPEQSFEAIVDAIMQQVLGRVGALDVPPLAICLAIPGIIDTDHGTIVQSAPFSLNGFSYAQRFGTRYGLPFFVDNDAKCCAWLQCALNRNSGRDSFLCVLAKDYAARTRIPYPGNFKNGIGVGIAVTMGGHVVNGKNYAVGEYVSCSWRTDRQGQTGLPDAVVSTINLLDDSYRAWLADLFSTLTVFVSLLQPEAVYFHGQPDSRRQLILDTLERDIPQFGAMVGRSGSQFCIMQEDPLEIARGAALGFIQRMFEVPSPKSPQSYSRMGWDDLFRVQGEQADVLRQRQKGA